MRILLIIFVFTISSFGFLDLFAQKDTKLQNINKFPKMSEADSLGLIGLPVLTMPAELKAAKLNLPHIVENSEEIHWRPVFAQEQFECGQASGVGLGFTYAINRVRDVSGTEEENQYPSHFTWNFGNEGDGWYGVSYFHSFEIIKREGCPNVIDFDGMTGTGPEMWMTGYDKYYNAMKNRVADVYKIDMTTEEGVNTLRNWIHNHLEGSDVGGVANFYANSPSAWQTLPSGTPEAGKYVVSSWSYANHGMTVSGYHDSICWDYNSDGQYTNDIDLNGDGVITPQDWEIGGLRFANTYSGGPTWANNGFSYMTYKSCADPAGNGGIWDNAVHVVYAKANTEPLLTAKIKVKYNCRNRLKISMGVSTDQTAESPDFVLEFPLFNYQGGCQYMQGGTSNEDHKTIELGLDITPFLNMIEPGTAARYFLLLEEDDPEGWAWGQMNEFSVIDYTNGEEEIVCEETNESLNPDDVTIFWVDHTIDHEEVEITSDALPPATVYEPYAGQLEAEGGTEPYTWYFDMNYTESSEIGTFPNTSDEQLTLNDNNSGYAIKSLEFTFPFYGENFDQVRVNADGYISFEAMADWPYQVYDFFHYTKNKLISPFQSDLRIYSAVDDGVWYEGDENSATFRWQASVNGYQNNSELHFAVTLFPNGDIQYFYGETNDYPEIEWICGLSAGDNTFYQFLEINNDSSILPDLSIDLEATQYPEGFMVTRSGELTGTATQNISDLGIKFLVIDENNLQDSKVVDFSTDGSNYLVIKNVFINSGGDDVIEFGETAELTIEIESLGEETIVDADMVVAGSGELVSLLDSLEFLGSFAPGEIKSFENAFQFEVSNAIPDGFEFSFSTQIVDDIEEEWNSHIFLTAYAPDVHVAGVMIDDNASGGLDPGETADMIISLKNEGGAKVTGIEAILSSNDPFITINSSVFALDYINAGGTGSLVFNVTASESTPPAYIIELDLEIIADNDYSTTDQAFVACGLLMEGFESGNFENYPWTFDGEADWEIDGNIKYDGAYSSRSGDIEDLESSITELELFVLSDGEISFYRKVSSEVNYDYLVFYIDGSMKDGWDGEQDWAQFSYPITAGLHTFTWSFEKDYSVSNGSDCGWIDNITLPPYGDQDPQMVYSPISMQVIIQENIVVVDTLKITNTGIGPLVYTLYNADTTGQPADWLTIGSQGGGLNPETNHQIPVYFDGTQLEAGLYETNLIILDHMDNEYIVPCLFTVDLEIGIDENTFLSEVQVSPNPFRNQVSISFELNQSQQVRLEIFNASGERVATLLEGQSLLPGKHLVKWNGNTKGGLPAKSGIYYYRIQLNNELHTGKLIMLD